MSSVIYARVPSDLKERADEYARRNDWRPAYAVAELLERGLRRAERVAALGARIAELEAALSATHAHLSEAKARAGLLVERQRTLEAAYRALADRLAQRLGDCPTCASVVTGQDVLVAGRCPNPSCRSLLTPLMTSRPKALDEQEMLLLIGAVGLVLGIALIQANST